ncbi:MAG TPA: retropepsin-like aspartic protease, partial [Anaerovoracaceae bacterium]|nr:retropepsin-like aspartic protease [Anaerovoracaceae bacterium]
GTLISQECVDNIGIRVSADDELVVSYGIGGKEYAFSKNVEEISIGNYRLKDYKLDFISFQYEDINGLLGLDILVNGGYVIDMENYELYRKEPD